MGNRTRILLLTAGAFLLRLGHVLASRENPFFRYLPVDSAAYDRWAVRIASGDWLGHGVFYQDPLYPYFLGVLYTIFDRDLTLVLVLQVLLGALNVPLVWAIGTRLCGTRVGWTAALLAALYSPFWFYDGLVLKTFLEVLLLNAALWALLRAERSAAGPEPPQLERRAPRHRKPAHANSKAAPRTGVSGNATKGSALWGALSGFFLGLGALARANYLLLLPVFLLWLWAWTPVDRPGASTVARWKSRGVKAFPSPALARAALGLVVALSVTLVPVLLRNGLRGHDWVLTTAQGGQNFYIGNNPENPSGTYSAPRFVRPDPQHEQEDFLREAVRRTGRDLKPSEASSFWFRSGLSYLRENPGQAVVLPLRKLGLLWHRHEIPDNEDIRFWARYSPWLRLNVINFGLIGPLAVVGLVLGLRERRRLSLLYLTLGTYLLSISLFFVLGRYRLPAASLLLFFAAAALVFLWDAVRERRTRGLAVFFGSLALGLLLVHHPSAQEEGPDTTGMWTNLGSAYLEQGRLDEALAAQREAVRLAPNWAEARYNLGITLHRAGDREGALAEFRRVVALYPEYAEAYSYMGNLLAEAGDGRSAVEAHRRARAIQPQNALHLYNLTRTLAQLGNRAEARAVLDTLLAAGDPQHSVEGLLLQAGLEAEDGNSNAAAVSLRAYLEHRPDSPLRLQIEATLREWETGRPVNSVSP